MLMLFNYAVILQPKLDKDGDVVEDGQLLVEPKPLLAKDKEQATLIAGRAIPDDHMSKLDRVTVVVSPF